jgi:hypothetical protein
VRSTTFLFTTLCTSIQNFGEKHSQTSLPGITPTTGTRRRAPVRAPHSSGCASPPRGVPALAARTASPLYPLVRRCPSVTRACRCRRTATLKPGQPPFAATARAAYLSRGSTLPTLVVHSRGADRRHRCRCDRRRRVASSSHLRRNQRLKRIL